MIKRIAIALLLIIPFLHNSCKNDIDLLTDYKEQIVCFGILNPNDTAHYIRVSKVFLGEGNALVFAQTQDSIQLRPENMEVRVTRVQSGIETQYWILQTDTTIPREEGIFLNPHQIVYRGVFPVLTDGSTYRLTVTDLVTGYVTTSETTVVKETSHQTPSVLQFLNFEDAGNIGFTFHTAQYARRTQLTIRFYYDEQFIYDTTQTALRYVDWVIGTSEALSNNGGESGTIQIGRRNFLNMLRNNVEPNPLVRRISKRVDLYYLGAHDDLVTYIKVQQANAGSSYELPEFTNMENGLGLFTTRNTSIITNFHLDQDTQYALATDSLLNDLNFVR